MMGREGKGREGWEHDGMGREGKGKRKGGDQGDVNRGEWRDQRNGWNGICFLCAVINVHVPPLRSADDPRYSNVSMLITSMIGLTIMFRF